VSGVGTLEALGRGLGERAEAGQELLAVIDARRGEAFAALYTASGEPLWEPFVAAPEDLGERLATLSAPPLAGGSGAVRFREELASRGAVVPGDSDPVHRVAARHVCNLAEVAAAHGDEVPLEPIYLRPPDAQRWRERHDSQRPD
jgi:tRNA threonylcarbamoyladenosine biosynthesis protein TsaB